MLNLPYAERGIYDAIDSKPVRHLDQFMGGDSYFLGPFVPPAPGDYNYFGDHEYYRNQNRNGYNRGTDDPRYPGGYDPRYGGRDPYNRTPYDPYNRDPRPDPYYSRDPYNRDPRIDPRADPYGRDPYGYRGSDQRRKVEIVTNLDASRKYSLVLERVRHRTLQLVLQEVNDLVRSDVAAGRVNYITTVDGRMIKNVGELFLQADVTYVAVVSNEFTSNYFGEQF